MTLIYESLVDSNLWEVGDALHRAGLSGFLLDKSATALVVTLPEGADPAGYSAVLDAFTPTLTADEQWVEPLPAAVRTHLQHLRDYRDADPATITNTQTVHVIKDLIRAVFYLNNRYENEG